MFLHAVRIFEAVAAGHPGPVPTICAAAGSHQQQWLTVVFPACWYHVFLHKNLSRLLKVEYVIVLLVAPAGSLTDWRLLRHHQQGLA
jgi:hypothetical protein